VAKPQTGSIDTIPARLDGWFKNKSDGRQRVENFVVPDIGFSSETLMFDLITEAADGESSEPMVIRLKPQGEPLFKTYDLSKQYRIMDTLASSDVPVPKMIGYEEDDSMFGSPFYVMEKIEGNIPTDSPPYHMMGWFAEQSPEDVRASWFSGVDKLARIGRLDYKAYDLEFLDEPELGATPALQHIQVYDDLLDWGLNRDRQPTLEKVLAWLRSNCPKDEPVALAWGDSRFSNQIFQGTECVACIDWEMARLGNPVQDIAWWLILDQCLSTYIGVPRNKYVPSEEETLAYWEQSAGRKVEHLMYYKMFASFFFSVIMARLAKTGTAAASESSDDQEEYPNMALTQLKALIDEFGLNL